MIVERRSNKATEERCSGPPKGLLLYERRSGVMAALNDHSADWGLL